MKKIALSPLLILLLVLLVSANWTQEEMNQITNEIQKSIDSWTIEDTAQMLHEAQSSGEYLQTVLTDKGMVSIKIMGETILLNGKDISGNLGSKITHGDNSPIIEDVKDSQIAIGDKAEIRDDTKTTNINLNITLVFSIALSLSFIFNIYLFFSRRKVKKKLTSQSA